MKLNIANFVLFFIGMLYTVFGLESSNSNTNSVSSSNTNRSSATSKMSIFESFKIFMKDKNTNFGVISTDSNVQALGGISLIKNKPVNPFDPSGAAFSPTNLHKPDGTFKADGTVNLPPGLTVFYKGWVKFFRFLYDDKTKGPKAFYENPEFTDQFKRFNSSDDLSKMQDGDFVNPNKKTLFWSMITENEILFTKSRQNAFQTVFDTLKLEYISPISEDDGFHGGIKNMGSFKEGDCMKITTETGGRWTWVICVEETQKKIDIMGIIKKLAIKNQRKRGLVLTGDHPDKKKEKYGPGAKNPTTLTGATMDSGHRVTFDNNLKNGYWIILQDWSSCTKFCGGGTQTLHRFCVPPKPGGAPCEGNAIVNRACNEQDCPGEESKIVINIPKSNSTKIQLVEPKLTVLPFSDRPQRYDKCHVKESDLLYTQTLLNQPTSSRGAKVKAIQLPVRVVMNQFTISAFAGMNETDIKIAFDIKKTSFHISSRDPNCFILKEYGVSQPIFGGISKSKNSGSSEAEFCPFGATINTEIREQWDYDFNLFKHQCHEPKDISLVKILNDTEIEKALKEKKGELRIDIVNKKKKKIVLDEHVPTFTQKVKESSMQAIQKELKLENLLENEVRESQKDAIELKAKELEKEKHKLDCLNKALKEKQIENEYNVATLARESRLGDIKKHVVDTIKIKRARLKSKLAKLKKLGEHQLNDYESQIQNVRIEMMNSLGNEPSYNPRMCALLVQANSDEQFEFQRKTYCDDKMANDGEDHLRCMSSGKKDIIQLCCDNETDPQIPSDYKKCLGESHKVIEDTDHDDVRFFWGKPYQKIIIDQIKNDVIDQSSVNKNFSSNFSISNASSSSRSSHSESHSSSQSQTSSSQSMSMIGK